MKEVIRDQKRLVNRSIRQLEREKAGLKRDEAKLAMEVKKAAKNNEEKTLTVLCKDMVRMKKHQEKMTGLIANLRAVSMQMTSMSSTVVMTESMKNVTKSMRVM